MIVKTQLPTLQVLRERHRYQSASQSEDDTVYIIEWTGTQWVCSCPGFIYRNRCKHIEALRERANREGWAA